MRKKLVVVTRLLSVAVAVFLFCYVSGQMFLSYEIRRASRLLEVAQSVKVGDTEDAIGPLLEHSDFRWNVQLGAHEEYNYVFQINPWGFPTTSSGWWREKTLLIVTRFQPRVRRSLGFRQWMVDSEIAIKGHRVVAVQTSTVVEGRDMWLGAMWRLSEKHREFEPSSAAFDRSSEPNQYFVEPGNLNMASGTGTAWSFWTTPSSPEDQRQVANELNFGCLRSFSGCETVCDLLPQAARFFHEHAELAPRGGGWDEGRQSCAQHDAADDRYW